MANTFQWILLPFLAFCVIYQLIQFKNNWFSGLKYSALIISELKVCALVFLTKLCICYDNKLDHPWSGGAFALIANKYVFLFGILLSINTVISYSIFGSDLSSLLCLLVLTLIQIWISIAIIKLWRFYSGKDAKRDQIVYEEAKVKFPKSVRKYYENLFTDKSLSSMGWTQFSATFKTENNEKTVLSDIENDFAFKVIDIKEYVGYRFGSLTSEEESEVMSKFNRDYKFLTQINHQNIARIIRADRFSTKSGTIKRLVLLTKMATHSLDNYLKLTCPDGVGHDCARLWFRQVVDAVNYLHRVLNKDQPIAHMNIKSENILLYATNEQVLSAD